MELDQLVELVEQVELELKKLSTVTSCTHSFGLVLGIVGTLLNSIKNARVQLQRAWIWVGQRRLQLLAVRRSRLFSPSHALYNVGLFCLVETGYKGFVEFLLGVLVFVEA